MAQGGLIGNGCKVGVSTGSPVSWTRIPQVTDVVPPQFTADKINIDTHNELNNLHRYRSGLNEVSDPSFTVLSDLDPATAAVLQTLLAANLAGTTLWFRFEIPTNDAKTLFRGCEFSATVGSFIPSTPIGDKQTTQYNLQFNGNSVGWSAATGASQIT
jgi:hypothetical protein